MTTNYKTKTNFSREYPAYFSDCRDVVEVKLLFKKLAMKFHPDHNRTDMMAAERFANMLEQYQAALAGRHGEKSQDGEGKEHTYYYKEEIEKAIAEFVDRLIATGILLDPEVEANLIGTWLWITGETKKHAKLLGRDGLKAQFHSKRKCWFFTPDTRKTGFSPNGLGHLAVKYGAERIFQKKSGAVEVE